MILLKHIIYEHAIEVLFNQIKKNLFSQVNIKNLYSQYEQNLENGSTYEIMTFSQNGYIYHYKEVSILKLTSDAILINFDAAVVYNVINDNEPAQIWDGYEHSPRYMDLDALVELI